MHIIIYYVGKKLRHCWILFSFGWKSFEFSPTNANSHWQIYKFKAPLSSWNGHEIHKDYWYNVSKKDYASEQEECDATSNDTNIKNANMKCWAPKPKQPKKH